MTRQLYLLRYANLTEHQTPGVDANVQNIDDNRPQLHRERHRGDDPGLSRPRCTNKVRTSRPFKRVLFPGCVVCHSNHGITHPTDAKLGAGPEATCIQCHKPGDSCDRARIELLGRLNRLDTSIKDADRVIALAESSGMEVSDARLGQNQARDSLIKARVTVHSFRKDLADQDIQSGLKITPKDLASWTESHGRA